jgi:hypothetical protein
MYAEFGKSGALWPAIIEKAFALHRVPTAASYESIGNGGWFDETFAALGVKSGDRWLHSFHSPDAVIDQIAAELKAGATVTIGTNNRAEDETSLLVGGHAYTAVRVQESTGGETVLVVRNPWAIDGGREASGADDGYVTLTAADLSSGAFAFTIARV